MNLPDLASLRSAIREAWKEPLTVEECVGRMLAEELGGYRRVAFLRALRSELRGIQT